jgi:hypothetical protein
MSKARFLSNVARCVASGEVISSAFTYDDNYVTVDYKDDSRVCYDPSGKPTYIDYDICECINARRVLTKKGSNYYINDKLLDANCKIVTDGPKTIVTHYSGMVEHYYNELLHNDDGPAVVYQYGASVFYGHADDTRPIHVIHSREYDNERYDKQLTVVYYKHGQIHNENGPAVISDDSCSYWINNMLHNVKGPAVVCKYGDIKYYQFHKLHRIDGPAVTDKRLPDRYIYLVEGIRHRSDGPAYFWYNEKKYYINGEEMPEKEYLQQLNANKAIVQS